MFAITFFKEKFARTVSSRRQAKRGSHIPMHSIMPLQIKYLMLRSLMKKLLGKFIHVDSSEPQSKKVTDWQNAMFIYALDI